MINFIGVGSHKCATSWMHAWLANHPRVRFPGTKELHFWDQQSGRPDSYWLDFFPDMTDLAQGEITPAYAFLPEEIIERVYALAPEARIIYGIRNPIDRTWAHARAASISRGLDLANLSDAQLVAHFESPAFRNRSDHLANLARWRSVYPAEQCYVYFYDDVVVDPPSVVNGVLRHLGLEWPAAWLNSAPFEERVNAGPLLPLRPYLREYLVKRYRNDINAIAEAFNRDLTHWTA